MTTWVTIQQKSVEYGLGVDIQLGSKFILHRYLKWKWYTIQGGESKGNFFMEQAKMTPRKELCESKVSVLSFLPCY